MRTVNIHEAKTQLSRLIERALAGEPVVIARDGTPLVQLVKLPPAAGARLLGAEPGLVAHMADDFDAPLDDFATYMPPAPAAKPARQRRPRTATTARPR